MINLHFVFNTKTATLGLLMMTLLALTPAAKADDHDFDYYRYHSESFLHEHPYVRGTLGGATAGAVVGGVVGHGEGDTGGGAAKGAVIGGLGGVGYEYLRQHDIFR